MTQSKAQRQILVHGLALVFVGLVWGLAVPNTPFPRLGLTAHIQLIENGMLLVVQALVLAGLPGLMGRLGTVVLVAAAWTTWPMALSEIANAWWGTGHMLPIAAGQAGIAAGGEPWQELVVTLAHVVAALGFIAAWGFLLTAVLRRRMAES